MEIMNIPGVKDFGCAGDGVTDDTVDFQKAITQCGGVLWIDPGTYLISNTLVISSSLLLYGAGRANSIVRVPVTVAIGFDIQTNFPVEFSNFLICGDSGAYSALVNITPSGEHNEYSCFRDVAFLFGGTALRMRNAVLWTVDRCNVYGAIYGIVVGSTSAPDDGDSSITNSILSYPVSTSVYQVSSGGLRITNNKIIGGQYGYILNLDAGVTTSDLIVTGGNSFENQTVAGLSGYTKDIPHFSNVLVAGNQFANIPNAINLPAYANKITSPNILS